MSLKHLKTYLTLPLALLGGWGVALAAIVNFVIIGYVVYADYGNQFGLNDGDVITVVGSYDDSSLVNGTGTVTFGASSGNTFKIVAGEKTYTQSDDMNYQAGMYPAMTVRNGAVQGIEFFVEGTNDFDYIDSYGSFFDGDDGDFGMVSGVWGTGEPFNGVLAGSVDVTPTGAASYSIPIELPPGIGGLTPQLSLTYNSQTGNGLLGTGWSLGGLSAITRCPMTLAQDGAIDPVDLDADDRYCLDGQRLIAVTNSGCAGGSEYRTEIDSYARICAYGSAGTGPAWFKVWTKAGQVLEYANSVDSRIEAQGDASVFVWTINRIEDAVGNYLTVSYFEDNASGEYRPEHIEYVGNTSQGMLPYHSVAFAYESRNDISTTYVAGKSMRASVRLSNIRVYAGYGLVRDYRLSYDEGPNTGHSRITAMQRCDGAGAEARCQPETSLAWTAGAVNFTGAVNTGRSNTGYQYAQPIDVNGDGLTDLVYCTSATTNWQILISTGAGLNTPLDTGKQCVNYQYAQPIDYNADGKADLLIPLNNGRWYVLRANNSGFTWIDTGIASSGYQNKPVVLDVNGDGRDDVALVYNNAWYLLINNGNGFNAAIATGIPSTNYAYRQKIDYDGDGRDDILVPYANNRWYVLKSTGSTLQLADTGRSSAGYDLVPQVMDVNGDGRQDLVVADIRVCPSGSTGSCNGWRKAWINDGNGFQDTASWVTGSQWTDKTFQVDYNGDGRMDLIMPGQPTSSTASTWYVLQSTGAGFTVINTGIASSGYANYPKPGDYNGDGFVDLALAYGGVWYLRPHASGAADLLASIDDGLNGQTSITYKPLTDASVYTSGTSTYPLMSVRAPLIVVSSLAADNGIGGTNTRSYSYEKGRVDLQGRGFLGFQFVTEVDAQSQIQTKTSYSQIFPYVGMVKTVDARIVNAAAPLKISVGTWSATQPYGGVYQVHNDSTTETTYELDGSQVSAVTTGQTQFDAYGNPGQVTVTTTGGGTTTTSTTVNTYDNDAVQWHLGRLLSSSVTRSGPGGTDTRTSTFEYDPGTGLLTAEIIEPNDPQLMLRTEYGYDGFGNKTSVTVKDSGSNSYPIPVAISSVSYAYGQLAANGTYTVTAINAKGHAETQVIDARFGKPLSVTGPNGLTTQWTYDSLGRQIREIRADGTSTQTTYSRGCCAPNALYKVTSLSSGAVPVSVYYDRFGREVRNETVSLDGRVVFKDAQYDARGQLIRASRPYFVNTTPQWADYQYDSLGRMWQETAPDGGIVETTYNGLTTTIRRHSVNGGYDQTVTRVANVEGSLVQVVDEGSRNTYYEYDPFGNLTRVTDPGNNVTVMAYDRRGRKTGMDDPDMGHWEYRYDALGQLRWQKDAKNQVETLFYDALGRMSERVGPEGTSTWLYDEPGSKGIGKPWKVAGPDGYRETYSYDHLGRPSEVTYVQAGNVWSTVTRYDALGRVDTLTYPDGFKVKHGYTASGYLSTVGNADNVSEVYWTAQEAAPDGQITSEALGNGLQTVRTIDPQSGRVTYLGTYAGANTVQMLTYRYDSLGNLTAREDGSRSLSETFQYDAYNRLTQATIAGVGSKTWSYDDLGNITSKDGYTDYTYGTVNNQPHAVRTARGQTYSYDANGNMTGGAGRTITWNSRNLPVRITQVDTDVTFSYTPDGSRYRQVSVDSGYTKTTLYVGGLFEQVTRYGISTNKAYIHAAGRVVAIREREVGSGAVTLKYLHQDHLGSTDVITDASGQVLERQSFDAFGTRRVAADWRDPAAWISSQYSTRGYTGHEQLDNLGLIHMNGRVYDPQLGRFLSADPIVKYPEGAQGLNRYSYVDNNPLSRVDPSGYGWLSKAWKSIKNAVKKVFDNEIVRAITSIAIGALTYGYVGLLTSSPFWGTLAGGFAAGSVGTGTLEGGIIGAATALMFYPLHALPQGFGKTMAHGAVGGVRSRLLGGSFREGFLSAGFTQGFSGGIGKFESLAGRLTAAAVVGGTAAELGGGKFANGAVTGAFSRLFNDENQQIDRRDRIAAAKRMGEMFESMSDEQLRELMNAAGPSGAPMISITEQRKVLYTSLNVIITEDMSSYFSEAAADANNSGIQFVLEALLPNKYANVVKVIDYSLDLRSDTLQARPRVGVWCDKLGCHAY